MPEARTLREPAQFRSAIGGGGRLPRKVLAWQLLIVLVLVILLGITKHVVAARQVGFDPLSALPGGRTIALSIDIGGVPNDFDLEALTSSYQVDGVVNLNGPDVAEQVTASSLNMGYLSLAVAPGTAPTLAQLRALAAFMELHTANRQSVYIHDDVGGGRAVVTADMLLLMRGVSWSIIQQNITAAELKFLSRRQKQEIAQLISALQSHDRPISHNPYSGARYNSW